MPHVVDTKRRLKILFENRFQKIDQVWNSQHEMTWIRKEEFRTAYSAIKTRAISWVTKIYGNSRIQVAIGKSRLASRDWLVREILFFSTYAFAYDENTKTCDQSGSSPIFAPV